MKNTPHIWWISRGAQVTGLCQFPRLRRPVALFSQIGIGRKAVQK